MIHVSMGNSKDVTTTTLAAQAAEQDAAYSRDFKTGYRLFWQDMPLFYCCNNAERAGYWAAADEAHNELQSRRANDEWLRGIGR